MKHSEGTFEASNGSALYCQSWLPDGNPRALLVIVHGQGDHSGRFGRLVEPLVAGGFGVYGFDQRGFGRSPGRKGHIDRWEEYAEDVRAFLEFVRSQQPGKQIFLYGYSLGSLVVLNYVLERPGGLSGAILSSLPVQMGQPASPVRVLAARVFSRLWPTFTLNLDDDFSGVSRDETVREALRQDSLHHGWVTARWGTEFLAAIERAVRRAGDLCLPVLFLHGSDDPAARVDGVERYFAQVTYPEKMLKIYSGSKHEIHNDLDHARVAADVMEWMSGYLAQTGQ